MIDIGGRRLALSCTGAGAPTVILETGLGAESDEWAAVQEAVQTFTRVCRYDRAGRGASDPAVRPRSAAEMVEDLHVLLRTADIRGPYVPVGHSFGGLLMRLFAQRFPQDVRSLVLVDSMHEDQFEVFGPTFPPPTVPAAHRKDLQNRWDALQARFLELSSTATQTFVHRSGHFMQRNCPEVIVEAIAQAVGRSVRPGERSPEAVVVL